MLEVYDITCIVVSYLLHTGDPPFIRREGSISGTGIRIGMTICLDDGAGFFQVVCAQNHTISPEPEATYTFLGLSTESYPGNLFIFGQDLDEPGLANAPIINFAQIRLNMLQGPFVCTLMNRFGSDNETTLILFGQ